jgi:5-formyltetrahydrofolate cyclo-ligase
MRGEFVNDYLESEKRKVRFEFLSLRNRIEPVLYVGYSADIFTGIQKLSAYKNAKTVLFYLSYGSEVVTDFMVKSAIADGKIVVVPAIKTVGDVKMQVVKISKLEDANQSVYGIRQPEINPDDIVAKDAVDLAFIPAIAFDVYGYRIGYGKGYYDRWLKHIPMHKTVGLAYDCQITEKLPIGEHDLPVGVIITEKRIIQVIKN